MAVDAREGNLPTLEDVAKLAGVSRATVSRVVNGGHLVSGATLEAVTRAIAELDYHPNTAARALVTRRVGAVAVVVPEAEARVFSDPFFPQTYHGALTAFADEEVQVLLAMAQPGEPAQRMLRYLESGHVDGAMVVSHHGPELAKAMRNVGRPVVFIGDPGVDDLPYVDLDQYGGAVQATNHLIAAGATRIAIITGPLDMTAATERNRGFTAALDAAGLRPYARAVGDFTAAGGAVAAKQLIDEFPMLDGIFVCSDLMALGAMRILHRAGYRVPRDVRVVGFDDSTAALQTDPTLTTMTNPASELARIAGDMLLGMLAGGKAPKPVILQSQLIVRQSA